jgi:hypothetical protein
VGLLVEAKINNIWPISKPIYQMPQALLIKLQVRFSHFNNHTEFIVRVFDGDLSETKQEAMHKH